ncbi:26S protease regulatory subunit 8 homolog A [Olea europaea subsp. europaea]|uniref:26S protease regulatory subunit 8 homolog A n=1 Tax=Olea europaea subsp. europaea TaxID=158383 RepID=A0A8S0PV62_OLEEU|nr:26S protease regulatory subunit 8 homolog A [Olea europaea subsp. europaea]
MLKRCLLLGLGKMKYDLRSLKEELQLLQEPGSYVGEVVKVMGKSKVLVKVYRKYSIPFCLSPLIALAIKYRMEDLQKAGITVI